MKRIIFTAIFFISITNGNPLVTEEMIYGGVIDTIKRIPENIAELGNYIYKTEIKKEKNYWWYFKKNQPIKKRLKEKNIDYYTILKQGMYPRKVYDNSRESEMKKYAILVALAKENNIDISDITGKVNKVEKPKKKKLKIEMKDM